MTQFIVVVKGHGWETMHGPFRNHDRAVSEANKLNAAAIEAKPDSYDRMTVRTEELSSIEDAMKRVTTEE